MPPEKLFDLDDVSVSYDGSVAVENVSMSLLSGDYLGIVGPSGSGKTTLLKVMGGAITPSGGRVVRSREVRVGYVPQVESVDWRFPVTVLEVLLMASSRRLRPWASPHEKRRAREALTKLGLVDLASRHIRALSGGQQQRVFIARALMHSPDALLLDEPTGGVDVATRHDVLHLLHELNHDLGIAIVITTHDLNGIAAHMHSLVCLNRKVIAAGVPAEILTPEVLEQTYGAPMDVLSHGGMPLVVEHIEAKAEEPLAAHHEH